MPQKIDIYSIMRNEEQILPYFLRHYEKVATRIFVWEDQSDDRTRELLERHPLVTLLPLDKHGADDRYYMDSLWPRYKTLSRGEADWCILVDADEFVYHWRLAYRLEQLRKRGVRKIRCDGWTMLTTQFPTTSGQIYEEVQMGVPDKWSSKTVVFDPELDMEWTTGRHHCLPNKGVPRVGDTGIKLLHFRYLGPEYYLERNKKNFSNMGLEWKAAARQNLPDGSRGVGTKWYPAQLPRARKVI